MIGLEKEIQKRKVVKWCSHNEPISYVNIAKAINKPYTTAKRKIRCGSLTVKEALDIFNELPVDKTFKEFKYLFTEQED